MAVMRWMLGAALVVAGCNGGSSEAAPGESAEAARADGAKADEATPVEGIGPKCRELFATAQELAGAEAMSLPTGTGIVLNEFACVDAMRALDAVEPSMRVAVAATAMMVVLEDAGLITQQDIEAMRERALHGTVELRDTPLPREDADLPNARGASFYDDRPFVVRFDAQGIVIDGTRLDSTDAATLRAEIAASKQRITDDPTANVVFPLGGPALHADAATPFGTVADVMRASASADLLDFGLAVRHGDALRMTVLTVRAALPPPTRRRAAVPRVDVQTATIRFDGKAVPDLNALTRAATTHVAAHPKTAGVEVVVARDVPIQRVAEVLDALRDCTMDRAMLGEDIPPQCQLWQPIVTDG